jgi:PKD repeat protein
MKAKSISSIASIAIALMLALSMLAILPVNAVTATMYVDPAYVDSTLDIGSTFTVTVKFKDFVDLWVFQVQMNWNPAIIDCTAYRYGPTLATDVFDVLAPARGTLFMSGGIDHVLGKLLGTSQSLTAPPATGVTGVAGTGYNLVEMDFIVVGYGTCDITFENPPVKTFWSNSGLTKQPCDFVPATVETKAAPAPYGPTAKFVWLPVIPQNGTVVNFDATTSLPGFNGVSMCPITEYRWDFDDSTGWYNVSGKTIDHTFALPGFFDVFLEVYAPGASPDTDDVTKIIQVIPPSLGADIDLYCNRGPFDGKGPDVPNDAWAPQEEIMLYAKVTYNEEPVESKLVAFEVRDADDNCVTYRTQATDGLGIATISFRIPSMPAFGDWIAIAVVDVAGTTVADTMPFKVGWIIEIISVTPTGAPYNKGNNMFFELEITNIGKTTKTPTITIVVYDECSVPIGQVIITTWDIPGETTTPFATTVAIPVPQWAFVGMATVYANAFTALPMSQGVPYCPEQSNTFLIEKV